MSDDFFYRQGCRQPDLERDTVEFLIVLTSVVRCLSRTFAEVISGVAKPEYDERRGVLRCGQSRSASQEKRTRRHPLNRLQSPTTRPWLTLCSTWARFPIGPAKPYSTRARPPGSGLAVLRPVKACGAAR